MYIIDEFWVINDKVYLGTVHPSSDWKNSAYSQGFQTNEFHHHLIQARFRLAKYGVATGHLKAELYEITGADKPTGSPLAVSGLVDIATLPTTPTYATISFTFTTLYSLTPNHRYAIVLLVADGNIDYDNYAVYVGADTTPEDDGYGCWYNNSVWHDGFSWDIAFKVLGPNDYPTNGGCIGGSFTFDIGGIGMDNECVLSAHYIKSHPSPDPDTFEIRLLPECGEEVDFFDTVKIKKYGVTEFYGFVEEITPEVGEDGLEYSISGRCWKLITWKKWNERFQESREVGPTTLDDEGNTNIESGFFGSVKPEELVKFIMRCPISEHPKDKIRHKIGWGIASDYWDCCANVTADCFYPEWVGLRYTGLAWRNRGAESDDYATETLNVDGFVLVIKDWSDSGVGDNPWIDSSDEAKWIYIKTSSSGKKIEYFTFQNTTEAYTLVNKVTLCVKRANPWNYGKVDVYVYDGSAWSRVGDIDWGYGTPTYKCLDVSSVLDTKAKIDNARVYFITTTQVAGGCSFYIYHAYLSVEGWITTLPYQKTDDYFILDMGTPHDDVTAMLIECRNTPDLYAQNYKIQYASLSNCCNTDNPPAEGEWNDFTPPINVTNNTVRDILHSWEPEDNVRCIRIKLTNNANPAWEISQIYVWEADEYKYRLMDEGD